MSELCTYGRANGTIASSEAVEVVNMVHGNALDEARNKIVEMEERIKNLQQSNKEDVQHLIDERRAMACEMEQQRKKYDQEKLAHDEYVEELLDKIKELRDQNNLLQESVCHLSSALDLVLRRSNNVFKD